MVPNKRREIEKKMIIEKSLGVFDRIRWNLKEIPKRLYVFDGAQIVKAATLALLFLTAWTLVIFRVAQKDMDVRFESWKEDFANRYAAMEEARERGLPPDPAFVLREHEIDMLAQALYGVKANSVEDQHKYLWAAFNRVDIKSGEFSVVNSLDDVFGKSGQFMGYSDKNPILKNLREIAEQEYDLWKSGKNRPYDVEYVFVYWTPEKILLMKEMGDLIHVA